jgi:hypothetical protein
MGFAATITAAMQQVADSSTNLYARLGFGFPGRQLLVDGETQTTGALWSSANNVLVALIQAVGAIFDNWRTGITLVGLVDGNNRVFTTPDKFVSAGGCSISVYKNGLRVAPGDYSITESSIGLGYDTVTFVDPPLPGVILLVDYRRA